MIVSSLVIRNLGSSFNIWQRLVKYSTFCHFSKLTWIYFPYYQREGFQLIRQENSAQWVVHMGG